MTGSLIFDNALVVSLCNSINCKLWLWPWCRWKNWWLSLCSSVCGSTQSIFSIGNFCLFSWCRHVSYNYFQSLEQTPQYSRRRPNCEAGEGTVQVDRHCTGLDVMRSVSPRIVMNMIAARNFSFKSCQDKVCKRWRYCPWSNEPPHTTTGHSPVHHVSLPEAERDGGSGRFVVSNLSPLLCHWRDSGSRGKGQHSDCRRE